MGGGGTENTKITDKNSSGGFFLSEQTLGEGSAMHFLPVPFFFFSSEDQLVHTNYTLYARIGPQWLSQLRCLDSSQPTTTSLGQGCTHV